MSATGFSMETRVSQRSDSLQSLAVIGVCVVDGTGRAQSCVIIPKSCRAKHGFALILGISVKVQVKQTNK
jgi:hypothetical protein